MILYKIKHILGLQTALDGKAAAADLTSHTGNTSNPHSVTKSQVGLGSVENYGIASQAEAEAGSATDKYMTPQRVAQAIAAMASGLQNNFSATTNPTVNDDSGDGYAIGSVWVNTSTDEAYKCTDATVGAAVWVKTTLTTDELATVALTGDYDDLTDKPTIPNSLDDLTGTLDDIAEGTTNKQFTATLKTKLDGIESAADVTDAGNVGAAIHGASAKTTPVDADTMPLIDSAASNALKKVTWANIKATLKTYFDTLYAGSTGVMEYRDYACPTASANANFDITLTHTPLEIQDIYINSHPVTSASIISLVGAVLTLNVPIAVDSSDTASVRYRRAA